MTKPLESYFEIILRCAEKEEDFVIQNSEASHAAFLMTTLFKHAKTEMCIFSGCLFPLVYDNPELQSAAQQFLSRPQTNLKIAIQDARDLNGILQGQFVSSLLSATDVVGEIQLWDASSALSAKNHFAVKDGKAYRFELDHDPPRALANFGDQQGGRKLAAEFCKVVSQSKRILMQ